ncbi:MAG: magnesium protoporphyrin IX methyltransferase, partial [Cyanobacteria bacterium M_surface_10_m2_179]|nr:magnesium protoporphyrin IX methyltransferase [Cyanobacteria bacterium M_surface_10_m2_179]
MPAEQLLNSTEAQKAAEKQEVKGYFETTGFDRWNR